MVVGEVDGMVKKVTKSMVAYLFSEGKGGSYSGQWKKKVNKCGTF